MGTVPSLPGGLRMRIHDLHVVPLQAFSRQQLEHFPFKKVTVSSGGGAAGQELAGRSGRLWRNPKNFFSPPTHCGPLAAFNFASSSSRNLQIIITVIN